MVYMSKIDRFNTFTNLWANLGLPPPASTPTTPDFTGFSVGVGSKKPPNRSAEGSSPDPSDDEYDVSELEENTDDWRSSSVPSRNPSSVDMGMGSDDEDQSTSGIAHFLEHMLFLGSKK